MASEFERILETEVLVGLDKAFHCLRIESRERQICRVSSYELCQRKAEELKLFLPKYIDSLAENIGRKQQCMEEEERRKRMESLKIKSHSARQ